MLDPLGRPPSAPAGAAVSNLKPLVFDEFYVAANILDEIAADGDASFNAKRELKRIQMSRKFSGRHGYGAHQRSDEPGSVKSAEHHKKAARRLGK